MTIRLPHDEALPGLACISDHARMLRAFSRVLADRLPGGADITQFRVVRLRHRPGQRAVLSLDLKAGAQTMAASLWLFAGTKAAKRAAGSDGHGIHEPVTGGLLHVFPFDPHVPALARFHTHHADHAPALLGLPGADMQAPELVRFRPGLGAAFRWQARSGDGFYVKIHKDADARRCLDQLSRLKLASAGRRFDVPAPAGCDTSINAYAMTEVTGPSLAGVLSLGQGGAMSAVENALRALQDLHRCGIVPASATDRDGYVAQAAKASDTIGAACPALQAPARQLAHAIASRPPTLAQGVTHGDVKAEHIVFSGTGTCLLDVDDLAWGDPCFDLAMLRVRIAMLGYQGRCEQPLAARAAEAVARMAGPDVAAARLSWLTACAALHVARHHAQSFEDDADRLVHAAISLGLRALAPHQQRKSEEAFSCASQS